MTASLELSPAAEAIAWNVDLLTQILVSLPAKSLIRFKSVSKQWRSLISDSQFATKHHCRNPRPSISGVFLCWGNLFERFKCVTLQGDPTGPSLDYLKQTGLMYRTEIIGSSNGLLLFEYRTIHYRCVHYFVCNPTTQMCTLIPKPHTGLISAGRDDALFAFDPSKSPHYKVVILSHCPYDYVKKSYVRINIYSSKSATWKQHRSVPYTSIAYPAYCSGVIYWLHNGNVISGFDVDSEKLIQKELPLKVHDDVRSIKYFGECDGRLIHIQSETLVAIEFDILETDDDYSHWIVKCRVNLGPLHSIPHHWGTYAQYSVSSVLKGEEEDFALVLAFPSTVVYFNLKCNTWNVLHDHVPGDPSSTGRLDICTTACPYIQTLHLI